MTLCHSVPYSMPCNVLGTLSEEPSPMYLFELHT